MILITLLILLITLGINYGNFYENLILERNANVIFMQRITKIIDLEKHIPSLVRASLKHPTLAHQIKLLKANYRCGLDLVKLTIPVPEQPSSVQIHLLVANKQLAGCKYPDKITSHKIGAQIVYARK